ncbi:MAG: DUF58 domain-containing protein, partial [Chloroflexota bacterium]|nr:DUF58 domain-containing protein [Chloroflexota bacterium]
MSWKSTAKYQRLMVKEFDLGPVADVWVVVDMQRRFHVTHSTPDRAVPEDGERHYLNSTVEYAASAAASAASFLLERGRSVGLLTWTDREQLVLPDRGARQLWKLLEILALVQACDAPPLRDLLLTHQSYFAGNHSLVVVTPDTSGSWRVGLEVAAGKVLPATAIYIDAISFDPRLPRLLPQVRERGGRFTSY